MAGRSGSFTRSKFRRPRWSIKHRGYSILEYSLAGLEDFNIIFVAQKSHFLECGLKDIIDRNFCDSDRTKVLLCESKTCGQASTALWAEEHVATDDPLLVVSPDQAVEWDYLDFIDHMHERNADVGVVVSENIYTSRSMFGVEINSLKHTIKRIGECKQTDRWDSCGIFYFKYGFDFLRYCKQMITREVMVDREFWVALAVNEAIMSGGEDGRKLVVPYMADDVYFFNKPDDFRKFQRDDPQWCQ